MKKIIFFVLIIITFAQDNYYEQQLEYTNINVWGTFGGRIYSADSTIMIQGDGCLYFFNIIDNYWAETEIISQEDLNGPPYGSDIATNVVLTSIPDNGDIQIYEYINDGWQHTDQIILEDNANWEVGRFVRINDDTFVISAENYTNGRLYFLNRNEHHWDFNNYLELSFNQYMVRKAFYENEVFSGDYTYGSEELSYIGKVIHYQYDGETWEQDYEIEPSFELNYLNFGRTILKKDSTLFVGAPLQGDEPYSGFVYIYQLVNNNWVERQILSISEESKTIGFGYSIDADDDWLVVGSPYDEDAGLASGSAYVFRNINGTWQRIKKIIPSNLEYGDMFGATVNITNEYVFIGAPFKNGTEGEVFVYLLDDTTLHANFAGDVRNGNAPVTVQFTAVPQGNPTAYEWDFNSDGFIDSTEPNPQFTYYIDGVYTVTLTVYDETGSDEEVKTDYIQVVSDILFGDVNGDGSLDVGDLVMYIDFILGYSEPEEDQFLAGDVNYSGQIDIIDIVMVIDEILGN
jgi:hypothetical protein